MHRIIAALVGLALLPIGTGYAQTSGDVTSFTLDNGMDVVVLEDHRSPAVVHMVWYRTGAADEPEGKSGIAHFLEHLMFKETETRESGEFSRIVEENGGDDNAFTSWDYTAYFQRVAADRLPLMMEFEADRMANLRLNPDEVETERSVILEERAQRTDSNPGALFNEEFRQLAYPSHPYGIPVIGWRTEMETLSREDALAFYETYYAPNNAILVVAGDVTPEEVRRLAQTHYGALASAELPARARIEDTALPQDQRFEFADERVAQPYVMRSYRAPERDHGAQEGAAALSLLAEILGGAPSTSVLGRALQFDTQRSVFATAYYSGLSLDDTQFTLINMPSAGVTLAEAEADLDQVIAEFLERGIDPNQFERIKFLYEASDIYARDNASGLARLYGMALTSGLEVEDVQNWPDVIAATTMDDVMEAARALFADAPRVTGYLTQAQAAEN